MMPPSKLSRLAKNDVGFNSLTSCDIYNINGRLLVSKGVLVTRQLIVDRLFQEGYKYPSSYDPVFQLNESLSVFGRVKEISGQLCDIEQKLLFNGFMAQLGIKVQRLAQSLIRCCDEDSGAALAQPYLDYEMPYSTLHHILSGVVVAILSHTSYGKASRISLVCAAMTHDIGLLSIRKFLDAGNGYPGEQHEATMKDHPMLSTRVLERCSIEDSVWLNAVLDHHLPFDGSGFEGGGELSPSWGASLLAVADSYSARIRPRPYRARLLGPAILSDMRKKAGARYAPNFLDAIEERIGVYHPGTIVKLANGDMAVVCRHYEHFPKTPALALIATKQDMPMSDSYPIDSSDSLNAIQQAMHPEVTLRFRPLVNKAWGG